MCIILCLICRYDYSSNSPMRYSDHNCENIIANRIFEFSLIDIPKFLILLLVSGIFNFLCFLDLSANVSYVPFATDLSLHRHKKRYFSVLPYVISKFISPFLLAMLLTEYTETLLIFCLSKLDLGLLYTMTSLIKLKKPSRSFYLWLGFI